MKRSFEGYYFKHQKGDATLALIVGVSSDHAFIQVITEAASYNIPYPLAQYHKGDEIRLDCCIFSEKGIEVDIDHDDLRMHGEIAYEHLTPLAYDIMGVFRFLPMECRHSILSLHHRLAGAMTINGKPIDFSGGVGYIEGDRGVSFPRRYTWLQCNDFPETCCVTAAVADIPFLGHSFTGCICVVCFRGQEYRLATYRGVRIRKNDGHQLVLQQGRYTLEVCVQPIDAKALAAPHKGQMSREIRECAACTGTFQFYENGQPLFAFTSDHVSFEYVH